MIPPFGALMTHPACVHTMENAAKMVADCRTTSRGALSGPALWVTSVCPLAASGLTSTVIGVVLPPPLVGPPEHASASAAQHPTTVIPTRVWAAQMTKARRSG